MSISLIGFMGCGKTSVAQKVAKALNVDYCDTDRLIEEKAGIAIADIFQTHGEETFRMYESQIVKELVHKNPTIIATGGGIVENANNVLLLRQLGRVIWLRADLDNIKQRISREGVKDRPLFQRAEAELQAFLNHREKLYHRYCDVIVDANQPINEVVKEIVQYVPR